MEQAQSFSPILQVNMANRLTSVHELYEYLSKWRNDFPKAFRLDGKPTIGPANPAQWIFFEITSFQAGHYSGKELGKVVDGAHWNGIYYLTASVQAASIQEFLDLYKKYDGNPEEIFNLGYTTGKENLSTKRRLFLNSTEEINSGWFCKQHASKNWEK